MKDQPQLSLASWLKLLARNTLAGHLMPSSAATSRDPSSAQMYWTQTEVPAIMWHQHNHNAGVLKTLGSPFAATSSCLHDHKGHNLPSPLLSSPVFAFSALYCRVKQQDNPQ